MITDWFKTLVFPALPKWLMPVLLLAILVGMLFKAYSFGVDVERGRNAIAENAKVAALGERLLKLQNEKRDQEQKRVKDMAELTLKFNQETRKNEIKANAVIADLRAGALRLRIPTKMHPTDCAGGTSQAGASTSGSNAETTAELSQQSAEFLIGQARLADQVTEQLSACQAILIADRKID